MALAEEFIIRHCPFYREIFVNIITILNFLVFSPHECRALFKIEAVLVSMSVSVVCLRRPGLTRNQKLIINHSLKPCQSEEVIFLSVGISNFSLSGFTYNED